jgi:hypothetical protein
MSFQKSMMPDLILKDCEAIIIHKSSQYFTKDFEPIPPLYFMRHFLCKSGLLLWMSSEGREATECKAGELSLFGIATDLRPRNDSYPRWGKFTV